MKRIHIVVLPQPLGSNPISKKYPNQLWRLQKWLAKRRSHRTLMLKICIIMRWLYSMKGMSNRHCKACRKLLHNTLILSPHKRCTLRWHHSNKVIIHLNYPMCAIFGVFYPVRIPAAWPWDTALQSYRARFMGIIYLSHETASRICFLYIKHWIKWAYPPHKALEKYGYH